VLLWFGDDVRHLLKHTHKHIITTITPNTIAAYSTYLVTLLGDEVEFGIAALKIGSILAKPREELLSSNIT